MSVQALSWVFDSSPTTGADRLVLLAIANHSGKAPVDGAWEGWPGLATVAREAGLSDRTVTVALSRLIEDGHLERVINGAPDSRLRGDRRPNLYRIVIPNGVPYDGTPSNPPPRPPSPDRVRHGVPRGTVSRRYGVPVDDAKSDAIRNEPSLEPNEEPSSSDAIPPGVSLALVPPLLARAPEDASRLCTLLADLVEANGSRRPHVTAKWLQECERLFRIDNRSPEQVERAIRWSQQDSFWSGNVMSMPTLRKQYDRLRKAAIREAEMRSGKSSSPKANKNDQRVLDAMAWAAEKESR